MKTNYVVGLLLFAFGFGFAQTKDSLSLKEQERRQKNIEAGNPFKAFGYTPKIATLSKGKYLEFHDLDSIVKIGSFSYHVKRKVITGYTRIDPNDLEESGLGPEVISRWLSPDPLAEEFPSWSPYNYVMNNPVRMTDPTGLYPEDIHIRTSIDDNGNTTINFTLTGKIIDLTKGGTVDQSYVATLVSNLESLFNGTHENSDGTTVTVNFKAEFTIANSLDDIGENDHVFGIVDQLDKWTNSDGSVTEPAGMAYIDGNVSLIERSYLYRKNVDAHESGHLLGLDHQSGTFMSKTVNNNRPKATNDQRRQLFNRYINSDGAHYRNSKKDSPGSGNSRTDLKNALRNWNAKYDYSKLYKK